MGTARRWLTVLSAAAGLLIAGSPAIAAQAGPAAPAQVLTGQHLVQARQMAVPEGAGLPVVSSAVRAADSFHICLRNEPSYCLQSSGTGQQVMITNVSASYSNFHVARSNASGYSQLENGNDNCLRAGTGNVVKIENGPCADTDTADWWYAPANQPYRLRNENYQDDMLVHGHVNGWNVWHATPISGDWYNWGRA